MKKLFIIIAMIIVIMFGCKNPTQPEDTNYCVSNIPIMGCNMSVFLDADDHQSSCTLENNSNREIGYQIRYQDDGKIIFQDRRIGIGETSFWFQGQDDRFAPENTESLPERDLPINTWLDLNLAIYVPGCFPLNYWEMGPFVFPDDFWWVLQPDDTYDEFDYSHFVESQQEKRIKFNNDGSYTIIDR